VIKSAPKKNRDIAGSVLPTPIFIARLVGKNLPITMQNPKNTCARDQQFDHPARLGFLGFFHRFAFERIL
jgi:hypothetical protein